jgi:hypothetical protein
MGLNDQDREFFLHYFSFHSYLHAEPFHQDNYCLCFSIFSTGGPVVGFSIMAPRKVPKAAFESSGQVLTGEIDRSSTGGVDPVRGCLNNPSRLG